MKLPKILRVLIIDDKVAENRDLQEYLRNVIFAVASEHAKSKNLDRLDYVDVVFAATPDAGARLWQQESFDLTLIDSHFDQKASMLSGDFGRDVLFINAEYQGLMLFQVFKQLVAGGQKYEYRSDWAKFVVWSSLPSATIYSYPGFTREESANYWPKTSNADKADKEKAKVEKDDEKEENWLKFSNGIKKSVDRVIDIQGNSRPLWTLERVLAFARLSRRMSPAECIRDPFPFDLREWQFIVKDTILKPKYPYLEEIARDSNKDTAWRISRHDPEDNDIFLPLWPLFLEQPIPDLINYLNPNPKDEKKRSSALTELIENAKKSLNQYAQRKSTPTYKDLSGRKTEPSVKFLGLDFPNKFVAAATPLTGISVAGKEPATDALKDKVLALLDGPFGAVILKTTYLDKDKQWGNVYWPAIQVQSHMRSRCLFPRTGTATLWNTGRTALEMLPPKHLNELLKKLCEPLACKTHRVIISLGSKYHPMGELKRGYRETVRAQYQEIWEKLFNDVFKDLNDDFPLVEINVRHYLREIIEYYIGGDEYLSPTSLDEKCSSDLDSFWDDYSLWLEVIHGVAINHKKKLILKMPYRSDVLSLVRYAVSLRRQHKLQNKDKQKYGIRGISLVNALKTPVPSAAYIAEPFSAGWYSNPDSQPDASEKKGKYQMSGAWLAPYRNQLLSALTAKPDDKLLDDLAICVSGGVVGYGDLQMIEHMSQSGPGITKNESDSDITKDETHHWLFQIGTWALTDFNLAHWKKHDWHMQPLPGSAPLKVGTNQVEINIGSCNGACGSRCPFPGNHTFMAKESGQPPKLVSGMSVELEAIVTALRACIGGNLSLKSLDAAKRNSESNDQEQAILPRIIFLNQKRCIGCGRCERTYYCDAFMDRRLSGRAPVLEPRYCTGCGLCAQVCAEGALQLYDPTQMLILLDNTNERHQILNELGVPHLCLADEDAKLIKSKDYNGPNIADKINEIVGKNTWDEAKSVLSQLAGEIYSRRVGNAENPIDRFCLRDGKENLYKENRSGKMLAILNQDEEWARTKNGASKWSSVALREAYIRAAIWHMLIATDPGQVLLPSPMVSITTEIKAGERTIADNQCINLGEDPIKVVNHVVILKDRTIELLEPNIEIEIKLNNHDSLRDLYKAENPANAESGGDQGSHEIHVPWRNIRDFGEFFIKEFEKKEAAEKLSIRGLPWAKIASIDVIKTMNAGAKLRDQKIEGRASSNA